MFENVQGETSPQLRSALLQADAAGSGLAGFGAGAGAGFDSGLEVGADSGAISGIRPGALVLPKPPGFRTLGTTGSGTMDFGAKILRSSICGMMSPVKHPSSGPSEDQYGSEADGGESRTWSSRGPKRNAYQGAWRKSVRRAVSLGGIEST